MNNQKITGMENPVCEMCGSNFMKMELLNIHMKTVHGETEDIRISRLTSTIDAFLSNGKISVVNLKNFRLQ